MKVTAILKGHTDKLGRQTIFLRFSDRRKRTFKHTEIKLMPSQWDQPSMMVINHNDAKRLNLKIRNLILQKEVELLEGKERFSDADFFKFANTAINYWEKTKEKKPETIRQLRSEVNKVKAFSSSLKLSEMNVKWMENYKAHLVGLPNSPNTVSKSFKFVRLIILKAIREKIIQDNPFDIFPFPSYKDPVKQYLTRQQVDSIEDLTNTDVPEGVKIAATWFTICCFIGLRYSDAANFKKSSIVNGKMVIHTVKTNELVSIPILPKVKELFEKIDYQALPYTNLHYNRLLKDIQMRLKIPVNLTSHVARHTFGVLAADAGISQEVTAKLMGHKDLKTTSIYYKITANRIDDEMKKLG